MVQAQLNQLYHNVGNVGALTCVDSGGGPAGQFALGASLQIDRQVNPTPSVAYDPAAWSLKQAVAVCCNTADSSSAHAHFGAKWGKSAKPASAEGCLARQAALVA